MFNPIMARAMERLKDFEAVIALRYTVKPDFSNASMSDLPGVLLALMNAGLSMAPDMTEYLQDHHYPVEYDDVDSMLFLFKGNDSMSGLWRMDDEDCHWEGLHTTRDDLQKFGPVTSAAVFA